MTFSAKKIKKLITGHIFDKKYDKNSINLFFNSKKFQDETKYNVNKY